MSQTVPQPDQKLLAGSPPGTPAADTTVRVPWPKDRAPLMIKARCPICDGALWLNAGEGLELDDATGQWLATEINLDCENEPDIESDDWDEWHRGHYSMPYVDWLPLEQRILRAVRRKYYFEQ